MKRIATTLLLMITLLSSGSFLAGSAAAVNIFPHSCSGGAASSATCQDVAAQTADGTNPIIKIIIAAIDVVSVVGGAAAVIGVLVSAIRLITSNGDANAIASARSGLAYALIGIAVILMAQTIVAFVLHRIK